MCGRVSESRIHHRSARRAMSDVEDVRVGARAKSVHALVMRARAIMLEPSCARKAKMTAMTKRWWSSLGTRETAIDDDSMGDADVRGAFHGLESRAECASVVEEPARDAFAGGVVDPSKTRRLGNGGTDASRTAILHSLASIESWAMILAWDCIQRFGEQRAMPVGFYDDFVDLASDEGRHFEMLAKRLEERGLERYGELEAHDGLWRTARETAHSLEARLVVEHCVHEARGLDVLPTTIMKFRRNGDEPSATLLENVVYPEEITHCASGLRWFKYLHARDGGGDATEEYSESSSAVSAFHEIVRSHFRGALKPPFNDEARAKAGFTPVWYEPLAVKPFVVDKA